ncbi:hypothetical protein [Pseudomonas mosselii]|uniref:hypothetical protein n=1 Tax=Pseudomonas mosselii TaxID=78327 RepID=UPI00083D39F3|nr:hypothetical protein [Pseudomonas mosselii]ATB63429.1 hypothetical protein CLJ08_01825 [Pseudomonas mosselii]MBH3309696.1 hypothetical protein [Pseudomonas mosselii]MBH3323608.1 hypothetical protein [Pseudomonas mosselii]MBS9759467.1 hypothetical protein [Pseudomonas mosselii]MCL8299672.1 hypothetical protein [Pseudomonas mosselii]
MNRLCTLGLAAAGLLALGGCNPSMKPLGYHAEKPYVPMSLVVMPDGYTRFDIQERNELTAAVRSSGAFSFVDHGVPRKGYGLVITQPPGKGAGVLVALNALTLLTFPMPYSYVHNLTGQVYKDGQLLRTFSYKREGLSVAAWYVPPPITENQRQMLTELMSDLEASALIPHVGDEGQEAVSAGLGLSGAE